MSPNQILSNEKEDTPDWLLRYRPGRRFPRKKFFDSRVVYYPAAGADFHPLEIFGLSGSAHCFVMADYWITRYDAEDFIKSAALPGYSCVSLDSISLADVFHPHWTRHFDKELFEEESRQRFSMVTERFAFFAVFEGVDRFGLLYLGFEAVEAYDRLFCQRRSSAPPYGILVQNHAMGGDWNQMSNPKSYVAQLAAEFGRPKWLVGQDDYEIWNDYLAVSDITHGGMHGHARRLFQDKNSKL